MRQLLMAGLSFVRIQRHYLQSTYMIESQQPVHALLIGGFF